MKLFSIFIAFLVCCSGKTQDIECYFPWENDINKLLMPKTTETIPLLINSSDYRVIKITNSSSNVFKLKNVESNATDANVDVYYLPVMKNYSGKSIIDAILPLSKQKIALSKGNSAYFLVKFTGKSAGAETVNIKFVGENSIRTISKKVLVGSQRSNVNFNLNVWCYFNYPLVNGLKTTVISDLKAHGANVIVIPPYRLPSINSPNGVFDTKALDLYLAGTKGNFEHFILFLGYNSSKNIMSSRWKVAFKKWMSAVKSVFVKYGIDFSKVMLYPYDEPQGQVATDYINMYKWCRANNINNPFFVTVLSEQAAGLVKYADYAQVYAKANVLNKVKSIKGKKAEIWTYEIKPSRNATPFAYLNFAWRATLWGVSGIGVWNYGDVGQQFNAKAFTSLSASGKGSWQMSTSRPEKDYSLVYRKGNLLVSSLRWEALKLGMQDIVFLNMYRSRYGQQKLNGILNNMIRSANNVAAWESIKVQLLRK